MGGAQKVIFHLAKHHDRGKFTPVVGSLRRAGPLEGLMRRARADVVYFDKKSSFDIGCVLRLRRYICEQGVGIVNAHNSSASFWGRIACSGLNDVAFVITEHGRTGALTLKLRLFNRILAGGVDAIIAVSEETATYIESAYPYNSRKVRIVINGIDFPDGPGWSKEKLESEFGIPAGSNVVANVAALTQVKDQALLIRALDMLRREVPDVRLLLIGDGPLRGDLEELAGGLGLSEHVVFAGERIDGPGIVAACDVFCLSSRAEGISIAALEAMACSCPVVLTAVGGNPEVIRDNIEGFLVPHGKPEYLASALERILKDRELANRLASAAGRRLVADFSAEAMTDRTEEIYAETLGVLR
jgi:glycosyltransferase involved in cell wall biosynthesis